MKAVVQRVSEAAVLVDGEELSRIGPGMLVLLGVMATDEREQAVALARKLADFRFFADAGGRMERSIREVGGEALVVSQVTLAADGRKGRRPSLDGAAPPERGRGSTRPSPRSCARWVCGPARGASARSWKCASRTPDP